MGLTALWWWIDRWRKSTAYTDMTLDQQGAYRNLIDEATLRGGALPNDERILAKASGDALVWKRVRDVVMARFELKPDGWHNNTLDEVLKESKRRAEKQARYRNKKSNDDGNDSGNDSGNTSGNSDGYPDPGPSPDPDQGPDPELVSPAGAPADRQLTPSGWGAPLHGREHREHASCGRPCVPAFQHRQFVSHLGSSVPDPDTTLRAWYREEQGALAADVIIADKVKFWDSRFASRFGPPPSVNRRPAKPSHTPADVDKYAGITKGLDRVD